MRADLALLPEPADDGALPPEERSWLRATALVQALATSVALWAFLVSVSPRVLSPGDVLPLVMLRSERLADGRLLSWARFEIGPTLAAVAMVGLAVAAQGLLRHHWRRSGLERALPGRPLPESRRVLACGVAALLVYVPRRLLETWRPTVLWSYIPILGGLIELAALLLRLDGHPGGLADAAVPRPRGRPLAGTGAGPDPSGGGSRPLPVVLGPLTAAA